MLGVTRATAAHCRPAAGRPAGAPVAPRAARPAPRGLPRATAEAKTEAKKKKKDEDDFGDGPDVAPSTLQVQTFLNTLCADTDIAQIELKMGTFNMKVRRSVDALPETAPAAAAAAPATEAGSVTILTSDGMGGPATPEDSVDEALVYVTAPKVGIFRRGKYAANKRIGKDNQINDGEIVKKGQTVAYVEQLGTFSEIKAPQAGEVARFITEEGAPVEFGQTVLELAPFFGGHIIGDSKYA